MKAIISDEMRSCDRSDREDDILDIKESCKGWEISVLPSRARGFHWAAHDGVRTSISSKAFICSRYEAYRAAEIAVKAHIAKSSA